MKDDDFYKYRQTINQKFLIDTYRKLGLHIPDDLNRLELDQAEVAHEIALLIYKIFLYIKGICELQIDEQKKIDEFVKEYKEAVLHHKHDVELSKEYEQHHNADLKHEHEVYESIMHELENLAHKNPEDAAPEPQNHPSIREVADYVLTPPPSVGAKPYP